MTHRIALVLSLALTLVLGAGVVIGRDRLFAAESAASPATTATEAAKSPSDNPGDSASAASPGIVNVTLPPAPSTGAASAQPHSERSESWFDHEGDDEERYEHDGEYDDD